MRTNQWYRMSIKNLPPSQYIVDHPLCEVSTAVRDSMKRKVTSHEVDDVALLGESTPNYKNNVQHERDASKYPGNPVFGKGQTGQTKQGQAKH